MEVAEAREALSTIGLSPRRVEPVLGGWANFTFEIDGCWMVRFPSNEGVAGSTGRELRLLPELGRFVDFAIPSPVATGKWRGWPFFTYRKLVGRPLSAADDSAAIRTRLAHILRQLHSFPLSRATDLLGVDEAGVAWRRRYEDLWSLVESTALPELPIELAEQVGAAYRSFVTTDFDFEPCLVHNDLFSDHVLVDGRGDVTGIIDFEDCCIGDPIIDFVPLVEALGSEVVSDLSGRPDPRVGSAASVLVLPMDGRHPPHHLRGVRGGRGRTRIRYYGCEDAVQGASATRSPVQALEGRP